MSEERKMKCDELKDRWFWAYPTESVDCDGITGSAHEVYPKAEVDEAIAELKATSVSTDNYAVIESMAAELEKLRPMETALELAEADNKGYLARIKTLEAKNRRLYRALYKACANWAHFAVAFFSSYVTKEKWRKMENKCLKKSEEYK